MKFTLCILLIALVGVYALTEEQKAKVQKWSEECRNEVGLSEEAIEKLRRGNFDGADDKAKKHALCFSKKAGLADESGQVNVENVKARLRKVSDNEDEVNTIVTKCVYNRATPEDTAFETFKCIRETKGQFTPA